VLPGRAGRDSGPGSQRLPEGGQVVRTEDGDPFEGVALHVPVAVGEAASVQEELHGGAVGEEVVVDTGDDDGAQPPGLREVRRAPQAGGGEEETPGDGPAEVGAGVVDEVLVVDPEVVDFELGPNELRRAGSGLRL